MKLFDLTGKKALVTGSTRGLGRGIAEGLLEAGAEVTLWGVSDKVFSVADEYAAKGFCCHGVKGDLRLSTERRRGFADALALLDGRLDILVNAAGGINRYPTGEYSIEKYNDLMELNAGAPYEMMLLAGGEMLKNRYGRIINVSSELAFFGGLHVPDYAASKGAVSQLTKAFCNEWAAEGITVNAIAPGYMVTDLNAALLSDEKRREDITSRIPQKRWGTPEDLKGIAVFLASDAAAYVNGAIIPVDGGYLVR